MIPPTMSTPPAAMPTRAAPSSNAIPAKARIPISSTKRVMPIGPSRVIRMGPVWCVLADTQIREARGQSAPGGMISGSVGVLAFGIGCCCIMLSGGMWDGGVRRTMRR